MTKHELVSAAVYLETVSGKYRFVGATAMVFLEGTSYIEQKRKLAHEMAIKVKKTEELFPGKTTVQRKRILLGADCRWQIFVNELK